MTGIATTLDNETGTLSVLDNVVSMCGESAGNRALCGAQLENLGAILPLMRSPITGNRLDWDQANNTLSDGCNSFPIRDGIPFVFLPGDSAVSHEVTDIVKEFYEETPFPNYDGLDTRDSLRQKARSSVAAQLLEEQIPSNPKILEVGCGTGQMTNFLAMSWGRTVIGSDMCSNSLRLASGFRNRFAIHNAHFVQMNLFRPFSERGAFDVIISNGVLHHTGDAFAAFRSIEPMLKPGGYMMIGVYNWLGRLPTLWLRALIERFDNVAALLDGRLRREHDQGRWKAWFMDQYKQGN